MGNWQSQQELPPGQDIEPWSSVPRPLQDSHHEMWAGPGKGIIAAGTNFSLAVNIGNELFGWGRGPFFGQKEMMIWQPRLIAENVKFVAAGTYHTIAILEGCGGVFLYGRHGRLHYPITNVIGAAAGNDFTILVLADGRAVGFGKNSSGQLGINNSPAYGGDRISSPVVVSSQFVDSATTGIRAVACSDRHSLFLTTNGRIYIAGFIRDEPSHRSIFGYIENRELDKRVTAISTGPTHSAVITSDGKAWTWDHANTHFNMVLAPTEVVGSSSKVQLSRTYTVTLEDGRIRQVPGFESINLPADVSATEIACGNGWTVISGNDGRIYSFGENVRILHGTHRHGGWLGLGEGSRRLDYIREPRPMENFIAAGALVACGKFHTIIYKPEDGSVHTCGHNYYGELGIGTEEEHPNESWTAHPEVNLRLHHSV
jgi:alpha-tubulin suppressor-like RCC1 family protein